MTRMRWALLGGPIVVAAVIWTAVAMRPGAAHHPTDCDVAREMIGYNKTQNQLLAAAFTPDQDHQARIGDYQTWANELRRYATQITAPNLAPPASRVAEEADRLVDLVKQARADHSVPADPETPPPWAKPYADLNAQFHANLVALDQACPAK
ncbi:MAG: hypothetical protein NVS4B6_21100 [Mycobacterium sp.]